MPLKTPAQIAKLADYKTLLRTDAAGLSATGAKFQYYEKFAFGDKTVCAVIFFGTIPSTLTAAVTKQGAGGANASGQATVNDQDDIELEVGKGKVVYGGLTSALKAHGVVRKLKIPKGALEEENGDTAPTTSSVPSTTTKTGTNTTGGIKMPQIVKPQGGVQPRRVLPPNPNVPNPNPLQRPPVPTRTTPNPQGNQPTGNTPPRPTNPNVVQPRTGVPVPQNRPPTQNPPNRPPQTQPTGNPTNNPLQRQGRQPLGTQGGVQPQGSPKGNIPPQRVTPQPQVKTPQPQPNTTTATKPNTPTQGPNTPNKPPTQPPPQTPQTPKTPMAPAEKNFRANFANLKSRYDLVLKEDPQNNALISAFGAMIAAAKKGNFTGALVEAGKVEKEIGKVHSTKSKATFQKARVEKQERRSAKVTETLDLVKQNYFKPGNTDLLAKEKLDAGKHFKAFLKAQKDFETARDEKSLDALELAAKAYRKHFLTDFNSKDQKKKENVRKDAVCATALKMASHYRLAFEQDKLGKPPWDEETEMRAAEIYTKMLFEDDMDKLATPNDPGTATNGAFWIEKSDWGDGKKPTTQKRKFIFKPSDLEAPVDGFPLGGCVAREMMGKTVGDQLQASMGLDFDVPETTVVSVDSSKIPKDDGTAGEAGTPRSGSIQHFATSKGELKKLIEKDPNILNTIPDAEVEKMAVLDLVQLNMDRHSGNFMVGETDGPNGKAPKLVPIDNGLCLPSLEGLRGRRTKLVPPHAVLGKTPAAKKKMSPEMVQKLQQIDPDEVVGGMKKSFAAMQKLHPDAAKASEIKDENFDLTKRSILFLKKAASELTLAEIQDAYVLNLEDIFESAPDKMEAAFAKAIQEAKSRSAAVQELEPHLETGATSQKMMVELRALGWAVHVSDQSFDAWVRMNPAQVMKIYKNKTPNPDTVKQLNEMREALKDLPPEKLKPSGRGIYQDLMTLQTTFNSRRNARAKNYGVEKPDAVSGDSVAILEELGGNAKVKQLDLDNKAKTLEEKVNLVINAPYILLGGDEQVEKLSKIYNDKLPAPMQKYQFLKNYKEYAALGGDAAYLRLGGGVENRTLRIRLAELKSMSQVVGV